MDYNGMKIAGYRNSCIHKEVIHIHFIANIAVKSVFFCLLPSANIFYDIPIRYALL